MTHDYRCSESAYQASSQSGCSANRDLLSENGADSEFESIPAAGNAQARASCHAIGKHGIFAEVSRDLVRVGRQIEQAPHLLHNEKQPARLGKMNAQRDSIGRLVKRGFDPADVLLQGNDTAIAALFHYFHAGSRARGQEVKQAVPTERRPKTQLEAVLVLRQRFGFAGQLAEMGGGAAVGFLERSIEAADAAEPGGQRHFPHRQVALVNQFLGELQAPGLRHRDRAGAQMLQEQSPQMA